MSEQKPPPERESWLSKWMSDIADRIRAELRVEGYTEIEAKPLKGPVVIVTIKGASEDTTAARHAHEQIDEMMTATTKTRVTDWADFRNSIRSMSKGDDLVIKCEIIFP